MREIKFRAYHKADGMIYYGSNVLMHMTLDGSWWYADDQDPMVELSTCGYHFMQYIGLKDKNGKEIYEGDIVKKTKSITGDCIGEVVYRSSEWMMKHSLGKVVIHDPFPPEHEGPFYLEVIGNIYENSKLLKETL